MSLRLSWHTNLNLINDAARVTWCTCNVHLNHLLAKNIWMFPKIGVPENGWFIVGNPIKMDDLGVPLFLETPIYIVTLIHTEG